MKGSLKKEIIKNAAILLLVIIWCLYSSCAYVYGQRTVNYQIPNDTCNTIEIKQGDVFSQEIRINKYIKELRLFVANGGEDRAETNQGNIEFTLRQGELVEQGTLNVRGIGDWTYIELPIELAEFNDGIATLECKSIDTKLGSSIFFAIAPNDIYEIPAARKL